MSNRMERANAEIHRALSDIVLKELDNPKISNLITITSVKTTPDFKYCKVGVSVYSKDAVERKDVLNAIKHSGTYIRALLANSVKMPSVPKLEFILDEGHVHTERINEILENLVIPPLEEEDKEN
ncbi:MAG: 30S ribosome-binding factor RbfA [Christensenellales bacterium]|jgi:ribosome-binding factor A